VLAVAAAQHLGVVQETTRYFKQLHLLVVVVAVAVALVRVMVVMVVQVVAVLPQVV
jgi:hypothetical protein